MKIVFTLTCFLQPCPESIWRNFFKYGRYEATWWGHDTTKHPDKIQADNAREFNYNLTLKGISSFEKHNHLQNIVNWFISINIF